MTTHTDSGAAEARRGGRPAPVMEREHDRPAALDHPRAPRRARGIPYFEKYAWLFMRFSGAALVLLDPQARMAGVAQPPFDVKGIAADLETLTAQTANPASAK